MSCRTSIKEELVSVLKIVHQSYQYVQTLKLLQSRSSVGKDRDQRASINSTRFSLNLRCCFPLAVLTSNALNGADVGCRSVAVPSALPYKPCLSRPNSSFSPASNMARQPIDKTQIGHDSSNSITALLPRMSCPTSSSYTGTWHVQHSSRHVWRGKRNVRAEFTAEGVEYTYQKRGNSEIKTHKDTDYKAVVEGKDGHLESWRKRRSLES